MFYPPQRHTLAFLSSLLHFTASLLTYMSNSDLPLYCAPFEFNAMSLDPSIPIIYLKNSLNKLVLTEIHLHVEDTAKTSLACTTGNDVKLEKDTPLR